MLTIMIQLLHQEAFGSRFFLGSALNLIGYLGISILNQPRKKQQKRIGSGCNTRGRTGNTELEEFIPS